LLDLCKGTNVTAHRWLALHDMGMADNAARPSAASRERMKFTDFVVALASEPTLSPTVKHQISEIGEAYTRDNLRMSYLKLKDLVGKERIRTAAAVLSRPILPVVDRKRSARLVRAQQASTTAPLQLKGSRRRKRAAPHNQDWQPNAKADRPKNRAKIFRRIDKFLTSGGYAGEPVELVVGRGYLPTQERLVLVHKCSDSVAWYENVHWTQAVSGEDYRERLTNNFKELEDEMIRQLGLPPRVIENAMPQLSVPFMVNKLKEFAVSSTHKELDRIQSEFTTQASSPAPYEPVRPLLSPPIPNSPHVLVSCALLTGRCNRNSPRDANLTGLTGRVRFVTGEWPAARLRMAPPLPSACSPRFMTERPLSRRAA
jgi:hypothetical protein